VYHCDSGKDKAVSGDCLDDWVESRTLPTIARIHLAFSEQQSERICEEVLERTRSSKVNWQMPGCPNLSRRTESSARTSAKLVINWDSSQRMLEKPFPQAMGEYVPADGVAFTYHNSFDDIDKPQMRPGLPALMVMPE
jgi:hypothetical protein